MASLSCSTTPILVAEGLRSKLSLLIWTLATNHLADLQSQGKILADEAGQADNSQTLYGLYSVYKDTFVACEGYLPFDSEFWLGHEAVWVKISRVHELERGFILFVVVEWMWKLPQILVVPFYYFPHFRCDIDLVW